MLHLSASLGVDLSRNSLDEPICHEKTDANNSLMDALTKRATEVTWTRRWIIDQVILGSRWQPIVGTSEQVVATMIALMEECAIDGFNMSHTVMLECGRDLVDLVVAELPERGIFKTVYTLDAL